jgi:phenylalanyl-tRNA synthetase beta chain
MFEVSTVFRVVDGQAQERPKAAIAMTGTAESAWIGRREFDFFDAKGVVEALMADLGIAWTLGEPVAGGTFHPGRSAFILVDGARVGVLGEIHPRVAESLDVPGRIAVAELEVGEVDQAKAGGAKPN